MLRKLIKLTKAETCSCAEGRPCDGCKHKKVINPQVYIEEPRRLTVPITISRFGHRPVTTVQIANRKESSVPRRTLCQWYRRRKALNELKKYEEQARKLEYERLKRAREAEIIKLYQKNQIEKAKLDRERQKQEYEIQKAQREREREIYELFRRQAEAAAAAKPVVIKTKPKKIKVKKIKENIKKIKKAPKEREVAYEEPVVKKTKPKKIKVKKVKEKKVKEKKVKEKKVQEKKVKEKKALREAEFYEEPVVKKTKPKKVKVKKIKDPKVKIVKVKTMSAKPKVESHYASVKIKRRSVVDSISTRFVNCCYKCCCQLYCWMTIILVIGFFLILYF